MYVCSEVRKIYIVLYRKIDAGPFAGVNDSLILFALAHTAV